MKRKGCPMGIVFAYIFEIILFAIILWLVGSVSVFTHEMGHAIGYMITVKSKGWQIIIGSGKRLVGAKRFVVNLLPVGGLFLPTGEGRLDSTRKKLSTLIGGPLATLLLLLVLLLLQMNLSNLRDTSIISAGTLEFFVNLTLYYNLFMFISAVLPFPYLFGVCKGLESDGLQIWKLLKQSGQNE